MFIPVIMLALESNYVVALRTLKLLSSDIDSLHETHLMVREKVDAAFEATACLMAGASVYDLIHRYRQQVAANAKRLISRE
jgi:hypothetical protein